MVSWLPAGLSTVTRGQIAAYAGVGLAAALVFMLVSQGLHHLLGWGLVPAAALGFALSLVPAYLGHRRLTFRSTGPKTSEVPRFLATNLLCFGLTLACTHFFGATLGLPALAALALTSVFVPALNFVLMACVVFVRRKGAGARG